MSKKKERKEYFFSSYDGSYLDISSLPNYQEVSKSDLTNRPYILIPDNNVCIHVSDLDIYRQDKTKKAKAKSFLRYVYLSNISVDPTWGLLERASEPGTLNLDNTKLRDFENAFWRKLHLYSDNDLISRSIDTIESMRSILNPMYMYLLKIKLILSKREPNSSNARANIMEIYSFMDNMQCFSAIIWQISLAIFGGDTLSNKLIKHGKKDNPKRDISKDIWGAAWDIYYLQLPHLFYGFKKMNNSFPQIIFATDDTACAKIGSIMKVIGGIDYGNFTHNQTSISTDFPHWKNQDNFLFDISHKVNKKIMERAIRKRSLSERESQSELETIIDNSSKYILEFTQELKVISNKGFGS